MNIKEIFANPIPREDLPKVFGCSDREARQHISALQEHYNIINLQNGKGYFLADDATTIKYAEQEMRRAVKIFNKARKMLSRVNSPNGIKIPVKAHFRSLHKTEDIDLNQITFL
jgi:biotin operon repressor